MKKNCTESLDDLEKGIKQILHKNRCLFSEKENKLLNDSILALKDFRIRLKKESKPDWVQIVQAIDLLCKLLSASEHIRGFF